MKDQAAELRELATVLDDLVAESAIEGVDNRYIENAADMLREAAGAGAQWHSVNDSLPEKGLWLVYGPSEIHPPTMRVDEYDSSLGWTGPLEVTHWRELPLPPEEL